MHCLNSAEWQTNTGTAWTHEKEQDNGTHSVNSVMSWSLVLCVHSATHQRYPWWGCTSVLMSSPWPRSRMTRRPWRRSNFITSVIVISVKVRHIHDINTDRLLFCSYQQGNITSHHNNFSTYIIWLCTGEWVQTVSFLSISHSSFIFEQAIGRHRAKKFCKPLGSMITDSRTATTYTD